MQKRNQFNCLWAPKDICWGCLKKQEQTEVLNTNLTLSKTIPVIKSKKSIRQNKKYGNN